MDLLDVLKRHADNSAEVASDRRTLAAVIKDKSGSCS